MTSDQRSSYVADLDAIQERLCALKLKVEKEHHQPAGCHWLVKSVSRAECLVWGILTALGYVPLDLPSPSDPQEPPKLSGE